MAFATFSVFMSIPRLRVGGHAPLRETFPRQPMRVSTFRRMVLIQAAPRSSLFSLFGAGGMRLFSLERYRSVNADVHGVSIITDGYRGGYCRNQQAVGSIGSAGETSPFQVVSRLDVART
jgi:hypothetical protein